LNVSNPKDGGSGYLIWTCNTIPTSSDCVGLVVFADNTISKFLDLKSQVSFIEGFAVDIVSQRAFLIAGMSRSNLSLFTVNLTSKAYTISGNPISIPSKNKILDVAYDTTSGSLFLLVHNYYLVSSLANIQLQKMDSKTGKTSVIITLDSLSDTLYTYISSSWYNGNYFLIMANESGFYLFNFNSKSISQQLISYQFVGIVANQKGLLLGNVVTYFNGSNTLATLDPLSGNITFETNSLSSTYCGAQISHAGLDTSSNSYFTVCCPDVSDCSNSTLAIIDSKQNVLKQSIFINSSLIVDIGVFWIPSSRIK